MNVNAFYKLSVVIAAALFIAAGVRAQDQSAITKPGATTNSTPGISLDFQAQPTLPWGDHVEISGLFVDLVRPQQTWTLFNPGTPPPARPPVAPELKAPVSSTVFERDGDVGNHGPGVSLLRFSFP